MAVPHREVAGQWPGDHTGVGSPTRCAPLVQVWALCPEGGVVTVSGVDRVGVAEHTHRGTQDTHDRKVPADRLRDPHVDAAVNAFATSTIRQTADPRRTYR